LTNHDWYCPRFQSIVNLCLDRCLRFQDNINRPMGVRVLWNGGVTVVNDLHMLEDV
jgi:hypothetical protein